MKEIIKYALIVKKDKKNEKLRKNPKFAKKSIK